MNMNERANQMAVSKDNAPVVVTDSAALLQVISRAATDPTVDMDKMERLFTMHERIVARNAEQEFNTAMSQAQAKMRRVAVDSENKQTHSFYASYAALDRVLRPIYTDAGFSLSFGTEESQTPESVRVVCHVAHKDGHTRKYHIDMPADGKGAKGGDVMTKTHATGSAVTYGMRYLLKLIFNVAIGADADDDDGNGGNTGMDESVKADYEAAIEALVDKPSAEKLWKQIAATCKAAKDTNAYNDLKARITKKGETLK